MKSNYKIKYSIEVGDFKPEGDFGFTDQVLACSYVEHEDGSGSYAWVSLDGSKGPVVEMAWTRKLKCLLVLVKELIDTAPAELPNHKEFLQLIFDTYRHAITKERKK